MLLSLPRSLPERPLPPFTPASLAPHLVMPAKAGTTLQPVRLQQSLRVEQELSRVTFSLRSHPGPQSVVLSDSCIGPFRAFLCQKWVERRTTESAKQRRSTPASACPMHCSPPPSSAFSAACWENGVRDNLSTPAAAAKLSLIPFSLKG